MRDINDLTIKEYKYYIDLYGDGQKENMDIYSIFELFGEDLNNIPFDKFQEKWDGIKNQTLSTKGVKKIYNINGKKFKAQLNHLSLKAGQFIDFQTYMQDFNLENVLSIFLTPMKKNMFGINKAMDYGDGYDIIDVQQYLLNNMKIGEANELSAFFLISSTQLLKVMKGYSEKRLMKEKIKRNKTRLLG